MKVPRSARRIQDSSGLSLIESLMVMGIVSIMVMGSIKMISAYVSTIKVSRGESAVSLAATRLFQATYNDILCEKTNIVNNANISISTSFDQGFIHAFDEITYRETSGFETTLLKVGPLSNSEVSRISLVQQSSPFGLGKQRVLANLVIIYATQGGRSHQYQIPITLTLDSSLRPVGCYSNYSARKTCEDQGKVFQPGVNYDCI